MIRKHIGPIVIVLAVMLMIPSFAGCGPVAGALLKRAAEEAAEEGADKDDKQTDQEEEEKTSKKKKKKGKKKTESDEAEETELSEDMYKEDPDEVFADMADWMFIFSSGAGGWGTELYVKPDGSFSGRYSDSDMGDTGPGYENGTVYQCDFSGRFSRDVRSAGPLMHSLKIESLEYEKKVDTEEIKDKTRYIYTGVYGLEGLDKVTGYDAPLVYMEAGAVTSAINEEEMTWVSPMHFGNYVGENWDYIQDVPDELPFAALLNTVDDYAFFTENITDKNKTFLTNSLKLPGLKNTELTINSDGTYYCVDENKDGTFRIINTCFKTKKLYDDFKDSEELVKDSLKEIYGKNAPDPDRLYVTSPKEAYSMQYSEMAVNGHYTASAFWRPKGADADDSVYRDGRFLTLGGYQSDTSFVCAYIIESESKEDERTFPDAGFANYYITSLMLTGRTDGISSAGEGTGAVKDFMCSMKCPTRESVEARELIMVGSGQEDLIKKYHLEDASFDDDYEMVSVDDDFKEYKLARGANTPFYVQYPKDSFHRLFYAYNFDEYLGRYDSNDPVDTCLMYLYLNKDNEVVYGYEVYTP